MELVWKDGRLSFIPFLKSSIPFHSGIFHIPYRNFRSIPFHFPFHSISNHALCSPNSRTCSLLSVIVAMRIFSEWAKREFLCITGSTISFRSFDKYLDLLINWKMFFTPSLQQELTIIAKLERKKTL